VKPATGLVIGWQGSYFHHVGDSRSKLEFGYSGSFFQLSQPYQGSDSEAVNKFASRAAEKLRGQGSLTGAINVFFSTSLFLARTTGSTM
jgi:hypothetical protein